MPKTSEQTETIAPAQPIRRFDVFAEFTRQERLEKGDAKDVAKGYGIWLAKVVAARRFGAGSGDHPGGAHRHEGEEKEGPKFRSLSDELQTDETFDHDIIDRMGASFYSKVFVPAIEEARADGKSYEQIRDAIRKGWKPAKGS